MKLLDIVKERLDIKDKSQDKKIQGYIDDITNKVKSICNRVDFPTELDYMAVDFARKCYLYYKNKNDSNNEILQVTSASDNGQSVNFKTVETITKDDVNIDKVIEKNKDEISMYAYMRW